MLLNKGVIALAAARTTGVLRLGLLVLIVGLSAVVALITKVLTDDGDEPVDSDPAPAPVVPLPRRTLPRADARKAA